MLKKPVSFVLVALRDSKVLEGIFRSPRPMLRANGYTKCGWYLLPSSLTAALLDGFFEHPEPVLESAPGQRQSISATSDVGPSVQRCQSWEAVEHVHYCSEYRWLLMVAWQDS